LLLFEWKPRSLIPVALASAVAFLLRPYLHIQEREGPLFRVTMHGILPVEALLSSVVVGVLAGLLALALTAAVYGFEDAFYRLPKRIHWMWWPAIGGLIIGVGGYFQPRALGVGYDVIEDLLQGKLLLGALIPLIIVKAVIWSGSLGSGTSGGVLAPLLIMGGALGAIETHFLPGDATGTLWPLVSMAAVLAGTMRCPLTGIVFALELTHDINTMPALLISGVVAYTFTVLVMKRSILTEKIARRGYHVFREYSVDPLELISVGDVMATDVVAIPASLPVQELLRQYFLNPDQRHQGYPVVDGAGKLLGVVTRRDLLDDWVALALAGDHDDATSLDPVIITYDLLTRKPITAQPWESCRAVAERMAEEGVGRLPVVSPDEPTKVIGIITRSDLLKPRARLVEEERHRERFIGAT
jgi:CBS domain-containing protein